MAVSAASIATYLRFACGHEALVSLPRVSGENARDRQHRIAQEKASAEARQCDFCPPLELPPTEVDPHDGVDTVQNGHDPSNDTGSPSVEPIPKIAERVGVGDSSVYRISPQHGAGLRRDASGGDGRQARSAKSGT